MDYINESIRGLAVEISALSEDARNARAHNDANLKAIQASLARYGQLKPIVVNSHGMVIVAGHGTVAAAVELGWTHVAATVVELSEDEHRGFAIADNRTADLAEWDLAILAELAREVESDDADLYEQLQLAEFVAVTERSPTPRDSAECDADCSGVRVSVGDYQFELSQDEYLLWEAAIHAEVGDDVDAVVAEIRSRIGLVVTDE